jgi:hypothetical protein
MIEYPVPVYKTIDLDKLLGYLKDEFSDPIYTMTTRGNSILLAHKKFSGSPWTSFTIEVKQPVIFLYDEDGNLLAYGIPEDQGDFESNFAKTCYNII